MYVNLVVDLLCLFTEFVMHSGWLSFQNCHNIITACVIVIKTTVIGYSVCVLLLVENVVGTFPQLVLNF